MPDILPSTPVNAGWPVPGASGLDAGHVREVIRDNDALLGVIVESGSPGAGEHYRADHIAVV
jgi:hypothetical protein